ncbi:MAG: cytochrome P460 family protein [Acidobacteriaceae bacterium]
MDSMFTTPKPVLVSLLALSLLGISPAKKANVTSRESPEFTADGQLRLPEHYREWVWLSSDFLTATDPANMQAGEHRLFNNFFVNPEAYKAFLQTGTWPDKTMLVLEQREAEDMGPSPNHKGMSQSSVIGIDIHVKDEARFSGKWAFFDFKGSKTVAMVPVTARCYSCHAARAAVDTTFVQFYPTLLPIAKNKATLSPAYLRESKSAPPTTK